MTALDMKDCFTYQLKRLPQIREPAMKTGGDVSGSYGNGCYLKLGALDGISRFT